MYIYIYQEYIYTEKECIMEIECISDFETNITLLYTIIELRFIKTYMFMNIFVYTYNTNNGSNYPQVFFSMLNNDRLFSISGDDSIYKINKALLLLYLDPFWVCIDELQKNKYFLQYCNRGIWTKGQ